MATDPAYGDRLGETVTELADAFEKADKPVYHFVPPRRTMPGRLGRVKRFCGRASLLSAFPLPS